MLTPEELVIEQGKDQFCKMIRARVEYGEKLPYRVTHDGLLLRMSPKFKQVVVPASLSQRILKLAHHTPVGAHLGVGSFTTR